MSIKIGLVSLGCPKNLVDSENMLGLLKEKEFILTPEPALADVIIVNTCGFIESAKEESIQAVLEMAEYKKSGQCKILILAGCLGERYAEELIEEMPEVDVIAGSHAWHDIVGTIRRALAGERFVVRPAEAVLNIVKERVLTTPKHTAYLKIAEGCDNACSYCVIPQLRGPYKSKLFSDVIAEAQKMAGEGVKELILVAQDVTRYGEDLTGSLLLPDLLEALTQIPGVEWLRLMYAYPQYITGRLLDTIAAQPKACKYLDIPLQHASTSVLDRMNRPDSKESITNLLTAIRKTIPGICLRTTFIVGFPGETEQEYQELKKFLLEQKFDRVGIFSYSQEEGTVAAELPQVDEETKERRFHELMSLQARISEEKNVDLEGSELTVMVETIEDAEASVPAAGRSYREAPDIDGVVYLEKTVGLELKPGDIVTVRVLQGFSYDLAAEVIHPKAGDTR